ncbi:MAG: UvrD-helicase domain-containing protein, partial [Patescibacteria group bacterium]|nr:UvrD-helicase domain-containing protein [Patescibacteria group bacterium]
MNFSPEQLAIFAHFRSGAGNLTIRARAGTGKTTTIKAAFEHAPEARILYAVFNKRNQKEAEEKIQDPRVEVKTLHSLGYAFIKRVWKNARPDDEVETDRILRAVPQFRDDREAIASILKLVGFAKNTCVQADKNKLNEICEAQDIEPQFIEDALKVLEFSKQPDPQGRISFNDMVWLPVAMGWVRPWYNLVCIDEAQDMNLPQLMMARVASSGRVIVVGDDRQAIYDFRGAVQDGMGMMIVTLRASELGLTTTYRCPKSVVRIAAEIVPDYKAADSAPEGEVGSVPDVSSAQIGDAILSRLNAPLMPLALSLLRKNIPARIEGRDIGRQLIGMVRTMKAKSVPHFIER